MVLHQLCLCLNFNSDSTSCSISLRNSHYPHKTLTTIPGHRINGSDRHEVFQTIHPCALLFYSSPPSLAIHIPTYAGRIIHPTLTNLYTSGFFTPHIKASLGISPCSIHICNTFPPISTQLRASPNQTRGTSLPNYLPLQTLSNSLDASHVQTWLPPWRRIDPMSRLQEQTRHGRPSRNLH